jgi:hypothetical protein
LHHNVFVKDLTEFWWAWKQISGLLKDTPLDDFEPFYSSPLSHFSSLSVLCNTWRIPAILSIRLISLCCNQTPKNWKLGACPFTLSSYHCQSPLLPSLRALGYFFGLPSATTLTYPTPPTQR